jgi:hypothetical protein
MGMEPNPRNASAHGNKMTAQRHAILETRLNALLCAWWVFSFLFATCGHDRAVRRNELQQAR